VAEGHWKISGHFNEEVLARAISESAIPVVSAIGHEVDFTISDFCADLRAPTPTAAAEMIIPDGVAIKEKISRFTKTITRVITNTMDGYQYRVSQNRRLLGDMDFIFTNSSLRLDHASLKLVTLVEKLISRNTALCDDLSTKLQNNSPITKVRLQEQRLQFAADKLLYLSRSMFTEKEALLAQQASLLDAVSPLATMSRGYSITSKIESKNPAKKTLIREK